MKKYDYLYNILFFREYIGRTEFVFRMLTNYEVETEAAKLRFHVYCEECGFIKEEDYPDRKELDEYDSIAVHFGIFIHEEMIGYMRLIPLFGEKPAPIEKFLSRDKLKEFINGNKAVEISRLVIDRDFRRRIKDNIYPEEESYLSLENSKRIKPAVYGLYKMAYHFSLAEGISFWTALMEPPLFRLLMRAGVKFRRIGEAVECMGKVYPFIINLREAEENVKKNKPELFRYFTNKEKKFFE